MATMTASPPASFSIGRVITRTFGAVGRNFLSFFALALISVSPLVLMMLAGPGASFVLGGASPADLTRMITSPAAAGVFLAALLLYYIFTFVLQAALVHGTVADLNGRRAPFFDCLGTGLRVFFPTLGIAFLVGWGIVLGLILLVVPGIMLAIRWIVSVPVRVAEGPGILSAMGRSADLTRGHRWPIFGLAVIFYLAYFTFEAVVDAFAGVITLSGAVAAPVVSGVVGIALGVGLFRVLVAMFGAVGVASIYYELRAIKEGIGPEHLAEVFS